MAKLTKRQKALAGKVDSTKLYPLDNALALVKEAATAKFDESIDVAVQLGIDAGRPARDDGAGTRFDHRLHQAAHGVRQEDRRIPEHPVRARRMQDRHDHRQGLSRSLHQARAGRHSTDAAVIAETAVLDFLYA